MDLSEMDDNILKYCKMMTAPLKLSRIDLVHVIPDKFLQTSREYGMPEGSSLLGMVDSRVKNSIQQKITELLPLTELDIKISLLEGDPVKSLLNYIKENSIDLLIAGRKEFSQGSGITAKKIARKAKCNFLFVPETPNVKPKRVMVPIDYSKNSAVALYTALTLQARIPDLEIVTPHVMRMLPADYHFGFDENEDFIKAHLKKNQDEFNYFIKEYDIPDEKIDPVFLEDHKNSISRRLLAFLENDNFDLVVMGAQGHSAMNSLLYGSVTERFVHYCGQTPLLVVR